MALATQNNSYLIVVVDDFNRKPKYWYKYDKTIIKGNVVGNFFSQFDLHQMKNNPTHFLDASSSCIDLIFTSQMASEIYNLKFVIKRFSSQRRICIYVLLV